MWRYLAGGAAALALAGAGVLVWGRGETAAGNAVSPLAAAAPAQDAADPLPERLPEASAKTREERRFGRYDKDRDGTITRDEYLLSRRKAYARLDRDGDGKLSFDEWAAKTAERFGKADADRSGAMSAAEFATTAPKRRARPRVECPPVKEGDDG
jgi:hypothetical protein